MTMLQLQQMGVRQVCVLVDLVWVMGRDASLCRKRKLCHHISDPIWGFYYWLLLLRGTLLALRSSLLALGWFDAALASLFVCYLGKFHVFRNSLVLLC